MFAARYFCHRYFPTRYFPKLGDVIAPVVEAARKWMHATICRHPTKC